MWRVCRARVHESAYNVVTTQMMMVVMVICSVSFGLFLDARVHLEGAPASAALHMQQHVVVGCVLLYCHVCACGGVWWGDATGHTLT